MSSDTSRLWTLGFATAMATNFFVMMVFYLLMTTMALYAVERFGAEDSAAGFAAGAYVLGAVAARMFAGKYVDIIGRRRLLIITLVVFVAASLLYMPAGSYWALLLIRFVHGAAFGAASTTVSTSVMSLIPAHRRGEGTGYYGIAGMLATAVGPFVATVVIDSAGYELLFHLSTACSAAALLFALMLRPVERVVEPDELANIWRLRLSDLLDPAALRMAIVMFFAGVIYSAVLTFLNSYGAARDMLPGVSAYFAVYAITALVSRLFVGRIQDRRGDNAVLYPALVAFAVGILVIAIAPNSTVLAAAGALAGFGFGTLMTCGQAIAVTVTQPHRIGIAISTFFLMLDAGIGLGPLLIGVLVSALGFQGMYLTVAVATVGLVVLYHFMHGHRRLGGHPRN